MARNIFEKRIQIKPYEYPELLEFKDAIRHSYWLHTEFNFTGDIQDYRTNINDHERHVLTRAMLAISQVEVNVKRFWGELYRYFPKPEMDDVGGTFAESEVRHKDAYSFLLEKLGLNDMFTQIAEIEPLMKRIRYMEDFMREKDTGKGQFVLSLVLFSLFVEHISLFGQFIIMMSFNKHKNLFKGISNAVEATSKEEEIHGRFGIALYEILRDEHSELFTPEFFEELKNLSQQAFEAERGILDWIFEEGDLSFISRKTVENYIMNRYNNSLSILGLEPPYDVDPDLLKETEWFDIEIISTKETDFFNKRSTDYSKKMKQITADDLF
ncbi:ribonucleotide-diphosphate reductase subunit beta [Glaesserella parasuis]|uniref:ribonucleotide-diphosphate reductase subunit beta n=1 Tax=Glaesserella parasuis TaxID=738 RepID=UPI00094F5BCF|nr:ribonucleotide-diphosphate reductase subunit beta [Glaesserella parasuis]MDE3973205.1 ribonucleotide-diphosphate reductase subunit beta [Glaesserella parasuis]MDE4000572.1 ribonucleotide-diphosphate reductase subunit beta [Glaesserella parasuis]MDG6448163.1 ribonucleotide-diphosphate reductase subunit beta [Glaesserella parasuis]MDG6476091.1 ribonucleotide-diphosphate reductase subunit beta [Glaesserella parasuis]MDP0377421.1 ribonucleotide-diphosphate reductase subunit beta [Glaesserella p